MLTDRVCLRPACGALLLGLLSVLGARPARAGSVEPAVLDALKKIKPADYPSANTVVLQNDQDVTYERDGQFTNVFHVVRLVLTPEGKAGAATMSIGYTRDAEKIEVLGAQVIKASGEVVPLGPSAIKESEES